MAEAEDIRAWRAAPAAGGGCDGAGARPRDCGRAASTPPLAGRARVSERECECDPERWPLPAPVERDAPADAGRLVGLGLRRASTSSTRSPSCATDTCLDES